MKLLAISLVFCIGGVFNLEVNTGPGSTPEPCFLPDEGCIGKEDGNYAIGDQPNYFLQCVNFKAYCQPCWPSNLVFKEECNQCLYDIDDDCYTTQAWSPHTTYDCPKNCEGLPGYAHTGNIADPNNYKHYIACWEGMTMGCVICPSDLLFNEPWNACLYRGLYKTIEEQESAIIIQQTTSGKCLKVMFAWSYAELSDDCTSHQSKWFFTAAGQIKSVWERKCLRRESTAFNSPLVLDDCDYTDPDYPQTKFTQRDSNSIEENERGWCITPLNDALVPAEGELAVLNTACDLDRLAFEFKAATDMGYY